MEQQGATRDDSSRDRVVRAALELFSSQGFGGTSMRQIAAACELSLSNLYHYFPSKEALFRGLLDEYWKRLLDPELPLNALLATGRFPDDLEALAEAVEQVVEDNGAYIMLIYVDVIEFKGGHIHDFYSAMADRFADSHAETLAERQRRGELGEVDPLVGLMVAVRWFFYFFTVEKCFGVPMHFGLSSGDAVREFIRLFRLGLLPRDGQGAERADRP